MKSNKIMRAYRFPPQIQDKIDKIRKHEDLTSDTSVVIIAINTFYRKLFPAYSTALASEEKARVLDYQKEQFKQWCLDVDKKDWFKENAYSVKENAKIHSNEKGQLVCMYDEVLFGEKISKKGEYEQYGRMTGKKITLAQFLAKSENKAE